MKGEEEDRYFISADISQVNDVQHNYPAFISGPAVEEYYRYEHNTFKV